MPLAACSTHQTLPGLVDWDTDRLSLLDSYWQGKMETTTMHRHAHTHTHTNLPVRTYRLTQCKTRTKHSAAFSGDSVLYVQATDAVVGVNASGQKIPPTKYERNPPPKKKKRKKERDCLLKISYTSYTQAHAFIWKRRTEYGARAPPPNSPPASF